MDGVYTREILLAPGFRKPWTFTVDVVVPAAVLKGTVTNADGTPRLARAAPTAVPPDRVLFAGLVTHAGHSYACRSREEILPIAIEEAAVLTRFRDAIGMPALSRSIGSTPTAPLETA